MKIIKASFKALAMVGGPVAIAMAVESVAPGLGMAALAVSMIVIPATI